MIKKGDKLKIKPEYQDFGDDKIKFIALDNESKGRVTIAPILTSFFTIVSQVVKTEMVELIPMNKQEIT